MDDHEYDAELAANISSEPESSDQEQKNKFLDEEVKIGAIR